MSNIVKITNVEISSVSASFPAEMDQKQWLEAGRQLCQIGACVQWWLGDWLIAGDKFRKRNDLGEFLSSPAYDAALDSLQLARDTLQNYASVSRAIQHTLRCVGLSWAHHREVASLESKEQKAWLSKAIENNWTVSELRMAIRLRGAEHSPDTPALGLFKWLKPAHDLIRCIKAAQNEQPIEQWDDERRKAWKGELQPLHEFYERL